MHNPGPKKPRLVFTDIQRRTLQAIFKETKRPSKEMQVTIAQQLGLDVSTVANFFMNARRRGADRWKDNDSNGSRVTVSAKLPRFSKNQLSKRVGLNARYRFEMVVFNLSFFSIMP
ncbi:homeobox domain protein [Trichuris suis]|nr:homeobox domain protein [Trichuris suis]